MAPFQGFWSNRPLEHTAKKKLVPHEATSWKLRDPLQNWRLEDDVSFQMVPFKYRHVRFFVGVYFRIPFHIWRNGEYLFPVHRGSTRFRAKEEQKLTAASVEAKKKSVILAVYGWKTAGFYHILVCIPKQVVWIMGTYIMTMTNAYQLVKDSFFINSCGGWCMTSSDNSLELWAHNTSYHGNPQPYLHFQG